MFLTQHDAEDVAAVVEPSPLRAALRRGGGTGCGRQVFASHHRGHALVAVRSDRCDQPCAPQNGEQAKNLADGVMH
jgi:hypothetical protein